jgi:hypothetical protein
MAIITARDLCRKILEESLTIGLGQDIEGGQLASTLETLNMELEVLNNENAFAPYESTFEKTIAGGKSEYTIGAGGDIELPRPISISWMKILVGNEYVPMYQTTQNDFAQSCTSSNQLTQPTNYFYEPTYPLGTIGFLGEMSQSNTFKIAIRHALPPFNYNDTLSLPSGYIPLLLWASVRMIPAIPDEVVAKATNNYNRILATIKSQNTKAPRMRSNFRSGRKYNIITDRNE